MKEIFFSLKEVFLSFSPARSFVESVMKYDFRIGGARLNLMQMCFSNLASWPLIPLLFLINFDPFKTTWSLTGLLTYDNPILLFLLDGHLSSMIIFFLLFYFLEWIFRKEYLMIALVFYFLNRGELHIHLATGAVLAVYLSRISYLWWLSVDSESETKKIWKSVSMLQVVAWLIVTVTTISALDYIQINYLFSQTGDLNRFNFLCISILLYHVFSHLFLSIWGHFYLQKKTEPSYLPTFFSTANWILRFNMSYYLQSLLKNKVADQLEKHLKNEIQFQQLKAENPALANFSIGDVLRKEIGFLKESSVRLGKI